MTYITARFGVPVAKPRPPAKKRKPLTEAQLATVWMDLAVKEGRVAPPLRRAKEKQVSGQLVERIFGELSDAPQSAMRIADIVGVSSPSACCALRILYREGRAAYTVEPSGVGRVRMWVRT